jgi:hypothetical protein
MVQVTECLLSKHVALSQTPSTNQKKRKKKREKKKKKAGQGARTYNPSTGESKTQSQPINK